MRNVHPFLAVLAFLLMWHPTTHGDCAQSAINGAGSFMAAVNNCVKCDNDAKGTTFSPAYCQNAGKLWCTSGGNDPCDDPNCAGLASNCEDRARLCQENAKIQRTYDSYIAACDGCQKLGSNSLSCAEGARDWCKSNCSDERCKLENLPECKSPFSSDDRHEGLFRADPCASGAVTKPDGSACPLSAAENSVLQSCDQQQKATDSSCQTPPGMSLSSSSGSMQAICAAYESKNLSSAQAYAEFGTRCYAAIGNCTAACRVSDTTSAKIKGQMTSTSQQCLAHRVKADAANRMGRQNLSAAYVGQKCQELAGANGKSPQSVGNNGSNNSGNNGGNNSGNGSNNGGNNANNGGANSGSGGMPGMGGASGGTGSSSPSSYSGYGSTYGDSQNLTQKPAAIAENNGQSGFKSGEEIAGPESFNVDSMGDRTQQNSARFAGGDSNNQRPGAQVKPIANNTGGSIPGGGDSGPGARLGGGARPGYGGAPGYSTDVLRGFQNGGGGSPGSASARAPSDEPDASGGFRGYGQQGRNPANQGAGMDLRAYLPGGSKDPRSRAGGNRPYSLSEINARHVNIFSKISDRFREKCRLGELFDCR